MLFSTVKFDYKLIRRKKQKHLRIRISREGEVIVSSPEFISEREIQTLLKSRENWICRHLEKFAEEKSALNPLEKILLHGEKLEVEWKHSNKRKRSRVSFIPETGTCLIEGPDPEEEHLLPALKKSLKNLASEELLRRTEHISRKIGIPFTKLFLRDQKTRWGSSSGKGNISLNWRVIMLDTEIQDYLIIHELCHQQNFNHSSAFWNSVARHCPDYKTLDRQLKDQTGVMSLFR
ncbi:MAG: M48 family metallopeptidase [Spirochaetales bacterium]|nr:M48 family metallopeptidase [Spirochaetales bacterium]